ncbi:MAG: hypothetical protein R2867_04220 [Caldilineaceae bacterium]
MEKLLTLMLNAYQASKTDESSLVERSVSFLLLGLICVFALNSIGNVQRYVSRYHNHWTGDALGIAFGTVVFVCAYIAATTHFSNTRWVAIVIGTVFGIASAYFQTNLYTSEDAAEHCPCLFLHFPSWRKRLVWRYLSRSTASSASSMAEITAQFQAQLQGKRRPDHCASSRTGSSTTTACSF